MGRPFSDITLYIPTRYSNDTPEYRAEAFLHNYISDLYVTKMNGYKPSGATRVCIQPAYYGIWDQTWKNGSIFLIAPEFVREKYETLDRYEKYRYILDIIQWSMLQLSDEYNWDRSVFEKAYQDTINCNFEFSMSLPGKKSRDRRKLGNICIEKTETTTFAYAIIQTDSSKLKIKLFEKINSYWYDCVYLLAKNAKWKDTDKFGISYKKGLIDIYYSISEEKVFLFQSGAEVSEIDFYKFRFDYNYLSR